MYIHDPFLSQKFQWWKMKLNIILNNKGHGTKIHCWPTTRCFLPPLLCFEPVYEYFFTTTIWKRWGSSHWCGLVSVCAIWAQLYFPSNLDKTRLFLEGCKMHFFNLLMKYTFLSPGGEYMHLKKHWFTNLAILKRS